MNQRSYTRLGTAFSETFPLSREAVRQVLEALEMKQGEDIPNRFEFLREETQLGTNYVKAMPRYAIGVGLLDDSYTFSVLGKYVRSHDTLLSRHETQWLMHYHLSAPHGPGPGFWNHLVTMNFRSGHVFSREDVLTQVDEYIQLVEGRTLSERSIKGAVGAFLGTYSDTQGLGDLGILKIIEDGVYRVLEPDSPSVWVLAYAILDYWKAMFKQQISINLNDLSGVEGITSLFLIGSGMLNSALREMQEDGYVEVHRISPPYRVVLLNSDIESIVKKIYKYE